MSDSLDAWLEARIGEVPESFRPWLEDAGSIEAAGVAGALEERALVRLRTALAAPGRERESAFHLLAADAWLTWAAEALLDEADPERALTDLLCRVASEGA